MGRDLFRLADPAAAAVSAEAAFADLRVSLGAALPAGAEIEHVGATAIPGCETKGDLDIVVRVSGSEFRNADAALANRLPRNEGSVRTDDFAAFANETATPPLGVQLVVRGSPLDGFVRFRDQLRAEPSLLDRYNRLKRAHDGGDMNAYRRAKSAFIEGVLASGWEA